MCWIDITTGFFSCCAAIATAIIACKTYKIAKMADDRENRICYAAQLFAEKEYVGRDKVSHKLIISNEGSYARKIEVTLNGAFYVDDNCLNLNDKKVSSNTIEFLKKGGKEAFDIKIDPTFDGKPIMVKLEWEDGYKLANVKIIEL